MKRKSIKIIALIVLLTVLGIVGSFLWPYQATSPSIEEVSYEKVAAEFISENDSAFIEDGYELKLVSTEKLDNKNIKMTFFYKLYSYPEGDQFRADVIVNTETKSASFIVDTRE